jgi:NifU-like protein involved in Fe-S cluster formation
MASPLYTIDILRLAASTARWERLAAPQGTTEKKSPICGSRVIVDVILDQSGRILEIGQETRACALGQASAALMGEHALGKTPAELAAARDALKAWLSGASDDPGDWPGLNIFAPALPHSARHPAILLAFEAVADAAVLALPR